MRRLLVAGVFAIAVCCAGVLSVAHAFEGDPLGRVALLWHTDDLTAEEAACNGIWQTIKVRERGERRACVQGGEVSLATYDDGSYSRAALKTGFATEYVALEGVCEQWRRCTYSSQTDTLVTQRSGDNGRPRTIAYRQFMQKLRFEAFPVIRYVHERSEPDVIIAPQIDTGAIALSVNGRWLALEAMDKGTLVFDMQEEHLRRVSAPGYRYGLGMNPQQEMAISEDGTKLVVTGWNSGFRIMFLDESCGESVGAGMLEPLMTDSLRVCPQTDALIGEMVPGFRYGKLPQFLAGGTLLSLRVGVGNDRPQRFMFSFSNKLSSQPIHYVALGDSFTSGEGEGSDDWYVAPTQMRDDLCHVSRRAYPALVSQYLGVTGSTVACSGARIGDVFGVGGYDGQGGRLRGLSDASFRRQEAVSALIPGRLRQSELVAASRPRLISLSIGGNDAGLFDKVKVCAMPDMCHWAEENMASALREEVASLYERLVNVIEGVQQNAPGSRFVVIGYPMPIEAAGVCDPLLATLLNEKERALFADIVQRLNDVIQRAAARTSVQFIDIEDVYRGTALCGNKDAPPSMNGLRVGDDLSFGNLLIGLGAESFHPTSYGHRLTAEVVYTEVTICSAGCTQGSVGHEEVDTEEPLLRAATLVSGVCQQNCFIETERGLFRPQSKVVVSLRSQSTDMGHLVASSDGRVSSLVGVPVGISQGYHTLILEGEMTDGTRVRYYQAVMVGREERSSAVAPLDRGPSLVTKEPASLSAQSEPGSSEVRGAEGIKDRPKTQGTLFSDGSGTIPWYLIVAVLVAAGIMAIWLLSVRLLRK